MILANLFEVHSSPLTGVRGMLILSLFVVLHVKIAHQQRSHEHPQQGKRQGKDFALAVCGWRVKDHRSCDRKGLAHHVDRGEGCSPVGSSICLSITHSHKNGYQSRSHSPLCKPNYVGVQPPQTEYDGRIGPDGDDKRPSKRELFVFNPGDEQDDPTYGRDGVSSDQEAATVPRPIRREAEYQDRSNGTGKDRDGK